MSAAPVSDETRDDPRTIGIAVVTAAATTIATELAKWAIDRLKEHASTQPESEER